MTNGVWIGVLAPTVLALAMTACSTPVEQRSSVASPTEQPTSSSPTPDPVTMPDLIGLTSSVAGRRIGQLDGSTRLGLSPSWSGAPVRCDVRPGTVVHQRPPAGTRLRRRQVIRVQTAYLDIGVFRGPCSPTAGDLGPLRGTDATLARRFYRFAADPTLGAPFAPEPVWHGIGSGSVATWVSVAQRADLSAWRLDTLYAERSGPFSALDVLAASGGYYQLHRGTSAGCSGDADDPPAMAGFRSITLSSPRDTTDACLDWWSVTLYLDEDDLIRGVALRLGAP
ncbi:PASTA domain-containing protein [Nocardioides sp.]|uniref:PASTA domain-containing protein n=1 Tax=Nocardioides sp. TaxID=35761 RepID=UPI002ED3E3D7